MYHYINIFNWRIACSHKTSYRVEDVETKTGVLQFKFWDFVKDLEIEKQKILTQGANMTKCCVTLRNFAIVFRESVCDSKRHI